MIAAELTRPHVFSVRVPLSLRVGMVADDTSRPVDLPASTISALRDTPVSERFTTFTYIMYNKLYWLYN